MYRDKVIYEYILKEKQIREVEGTKNCATFAYKLAATYPTVIILAKK